MSLKTLTFEGTSAENLFNMTSLLNATNIVLVNAKVITLEASFPVGVVTANQSISLEIGNTINSTNVIDNDPTNFYFKHHLKTNVVGLNNISDYEPNIGYKLGGPLDKNIRFNLRNSSGQIMTGLEYFFFQFQVI